MNEKLYFRSDFETRCSDKIPDTTKSGPDKIRIRRIRIGKPGNIPEPAPDVIVGGMVEARDGSLFPKIS